MPMSKKQSPYYLTDPKLQESSKYITPLFENLGIPDVFCAGEINVEPVNINGTISNVTVSLNNKSGTFHNKVAHIDSEKQALIYVGYIVQRALINRLGADVTVEVNIKTYKQGNRLEEYTDYGLIEYTDLENEMTEVSTHIIGQSEKKTYVTKMDGEGLDALPFQENNLPLCQLSLLHKKKYWGTVSGELGIFKATHIGGINRSEKFAEKSFRGQFVLLPESILRIGLYGHGILCVLDSLGELNDKLEESIKKNKAAWKALIKRVVDLSAVRETIEIFLPLLEKAAKAAIIGNCTRRKLKNLAQKEEPFAFRNRIQPGEPAPDPEHQACLKQ